MPSERFQGLVAEPAPRRARIRSSAVHGANRTPHIGAPTVTQHDNLV
jgi:hypothetical protein